MEKNYLVNKIDRNTEIVNSYFKFLDQHIQNVVSGKVSEFMEINQIATEICISHKHLTAIVQQEMGHHPCYFYDVKILEKAQKMLLETDKSIAEIARILTYDPSNFSKFFKKIIGITPNQFRLANKNKTV